MSRSIIAILRGVQPDEVVSIAESIVKAGISKIEVTLNSPDPIESIRRLVEANAGRAMIGGGTVLTVEQVDAIKAVGGELIVSPNCDPDVIAHTRALGMESWPGVFTPTEAFAALKAGATGLKLFPGNMAGPSGLKAMKAVLPKSVPVYVVGGAVPENFKDWVAVGAAGFGLGSPVYTSGLSAEEVGKRAQQIVAAYDEVLK